MVQWASFSSFSSCNDEFCFVNLCFTRYFVFYPTRFLGSTMDSMSRLPAVVESDDGESGSQSGSNSEIAETLVDPSFIHYVDDSCQIEKTARLTAISCCTSSSAHSANSMILSITGAYDRTLRSYPCSCFLAQQCFR